MYQKYSELDFGIRLVVIMMEEFGFVTSDSGDGVSKGPVDECVMPFPHVVITHEEFNGKDWMVNLYSSRRLRSELRKVGIEPTPQGQPGPSIQYMYCPVENRSHIILMGLADKDLPLDIATILDDIYVDLVSKEK